MEDLSNIDTTGSSVVMDNNTGRMTIKLGKQVTERAFAQILEYLYTDRVNWDKETDKGLITETRDASQYLQLERLSAICESYLDPSKNINIPESTWWKNMKWAFENLRTGKYELSDLVLVCKNSNGKVKIPCHAVILTAACKYFHGMLLGDVDNKEKKTMEIELEEATEKQMLAILKYIYTRDFDVDIKDVVGVWILACKYLLDDLQVECESMIMKNITKENVDEIKKIAEMLKSKRVLEQCNEFEK